GELSPGGRMIAFVRNRGGNDRFSTLCIASLSGGDLREIAAGNDADFVFPRWSPDGGSIAVTRNPHQSVGGSILVVSADGTSKQIVEHGELHGLLSSVAWTHDARSIVFA